MLVRPRAQQLVTMHLAPHVTGVLCPVESAVVSDACVTVAASHVVVCPLSVVRRLLEMSHVRIMCFDPTYGRGLVFSRTLH